MRIAVMGTGGVGGYFGARLAAGGNDVHFIARGAQLAAIREHGLRVASPKGDLHLEHVQVTNDPATIGPVDYVLFGVKLWDTETAANAIKSLVGADTAVMSFQNGVRKDDILRSVLGDHAIAGGVAYISATIAGPGLIRHVGPMQKLVFGEYDGSRSPRMEAFDAACRASGIDTELSTDIRRALWEKFVFLTALSGVTTAMRSSIGPLRSNPQARALLRDAMQEVVDVGHAAGVNLPADFADNRLAFVDTLPPDMTSSMRRDLEGGSRLEVQWLSGDIVVRGREAGLPTPVNRALCDVLALDADGKRNA